MSGGLIVVCGKEDAGDRAEIARVAEGREVLFVADLTEAEARLGEASAIAGMVSGAQLARAPELRWVHSWAAGTESSLVPEMVNSPIVLTSSVGNGAVPLAEHAVMLMLMLSRDARRWERAQDDHRWERFSHGELAGMTVGIIGLGHSGTDLAHKARAFHMNVLGVRRRYDEPVDGVGRIYGPEDLLEMLPECDFVVVTSPITEATANMFGEREFRAMKSSAFWICISRGGIADDAALLAALQHKEIAGAGLDAHGVEPLPPDSPFWDLPDVIVTPHNGATTPGTVRRGLDIFLDNLRRFVAGEQLTNIVDKVNGY